MCLLQKTKVNFVDAVSQQGFYLLNLFYQYHWKLYGILVLSALLQIFIYLDVHVIMTIQSVHVSKAVSLWWSSPYQPSLAQCIMGNLERCAWAAIHLFAETETISGKSEKKSLFMLYSKSSTSSKHLHYHIMEPQRRMEDARMLSNATWHALCATCLPCGCVLLNSVISHVYMHVCVTFCMYAGVRALSQTKPSRLPPHQARQVLLHWNESGDVCICNVVLSSSAWWNLTLLIIVTRPRKVQSSDTFSEVRTGSWGPRYRAAKAHFHEDVLIRCLVTFFFFKRH